MERDPSSTGDRGAELLARALFASGEEPPLPTDAELWAYAQGALPPDEQDRLMNLLARSEPAREKLERFRRILLQAARRHYLLSRARAAVQAALADFRRDVSSVVVTILKVGKGLLGVTEQPGWRTDEPALAAAQAGADHLGTEPKGEEGLLEAPARLIFRNDQGVTLSPIRRPDGGVDIHLQLPDRTQRGIVEVWRPVPTTDGYTEASTDVDAPLDQGGALLRDCPEGLLRLKAPGMAPMDVFVGQYAEEPDAPGSEAERS